MYILYKTINKITNKFYIGVHKQKEGYGPFDFDGYLGSGKVLLQSIEKHGRDNFERVTLYYSDDKEYIYQKERELVDPELKESYNINEGGHGGFYYINSNNIRPDFAKIHEKGRQTLFKNHGVTNPGQTEASRKAVAARNKLPKDPKTIEKQRQTLIASGKVRGANNGFYGRKWGENHPKGFKGKQHSEEAKRKIGDAARKPKFKEKCPHCDVMSPPGWLKKHVSKIHPDGF